MKKYEFVDEVKFGNVTLHRIRAVSDFGYVCYGEVGGWIESEENLPNDTRSGGVWIYDDARVYGGARVCDDVRVYGDARVCGDAWVYDDAWVCDDARVCGGALVYGDARVQKTSDYLTVGLIGSRYDTTTFFKTDNGISVKCGCFKDTLESFLQAIEKRHGDSKYGKAYRLAVELAKLQILGEGD